MTIAPQERQRRDEAYSAAQQDETRCGELREEIQSLNEQLEAFRQNFIEPFRDVQAQTFNQAQDAQATFAKAAAALKNSVGIEDYFTGFSPPPIESTVTDSEGNFSISKSRKNVKIFAKAQREVLDSTEVYYWLVDLPPEGQKLILSNGNLFVPPSLN